jgi:membrane protein DedA with SNARE-associated domain
MDSLLKFFEGFWHSLQNGQVPNLGVWNYVLLAVFVFIEGPIATLLGAAAASAGVMKIGFVFLAASTGNLSADSAWYLLGYTGRIEWVLRHGRWLGIGRQHLARLRRLMTRHAPKILFAAKLTSALIIPSLIAAGMARIPWRRWFPPILAGEVIWTGSLVVIGYFATQLVGKAERDVRYLAGFGVIVFLAFVAWLIRRALRQRGKIDENENEDEDHDT